MANSRQTTIDDLTRRNVDTVAKLERSAITSRTLGERWADLVASWVGSWTFLIVQCLLLVGWMVINVENFSVGRWDPYPFILLNLVLSFQAAFATPIILMSENRQSRLQERRNHLDLQINLLAEQENTEQLRLLHLVCEKLGISTLPPGESALEQQANPDVITKQIVDVVERKSNSLE